ncbi:protein of unknown function [Alteribacillus persepolensis]|uniref:DUF2529 domain-containing protein n=1 Tax=Alteribacillus persepolensis TaxID=568899 RepID=A0A1G8G1M8_9BACI|nr:DUF2529 family protein [Alteribacillus persepolensis]SDH88308.1 protein of unknown function [Alteribacillus persepolensis]
MKIFSTQLQGIFKKITEREEEQFEDGARLLAQAAAGPGKLLIYTTPSMKGNAINVTEHPDAAGHITHQETTDTSLEAIDRALILAGYEEKKELETTVSHLREHDVPFVVIAPFPAEEMEHFLEPTDVWIDTYTRGGLVPDESGSRLGAPFTLTALFASQLLLLQINELLGELD